MHRCTQRPCAKGQDGGERLALGRKSAIAVSFDGLLGASSARALHFAQITIAAARAYMQSAYRATPTSDLWDQVQWEYRACSQ